MSAASRDPGELQRSQTDQAVHAASGYLQGLSSPAHDPGMSVPDHYIAQHPGQSDAIGHDLSQNPGLSHDPNHDSAQSPGLSHDAPVNDHHQTADLGHDPGAAAANAGVHDAGYHHP